VGRLRWAPAAVPALNPAFDVTPADLVTSLITDRGVYDRAALAAGALGAAAG
jgi:methylthioribose-1-phosphate isomerase